MKKILFIIVLSIVLFGKTSYSDPKIYYFELGNKAYNQKDFTKAKQYYKIASDYGNFKASYNLGVLFGREKKYEKAYSLFLQAATQNYPQAQNKVGLFLLYGWGVEKDYKKSLQWFERSYFENNYLPAVCNLSYMFVNGYGAMFNLGRAAKLARIGMKEDIPRCKKIYEEYKLKKYKEDRGFKSGYYAD